MTQIAGRTYHMARLGKQILRKQGLRVYLHASADREDRDRIAAFAEIVQKAPADLVLARDPAQLGDLFKLVASDGLIIASARLAEGQARAIAVHAHENGMHADFRSLAHGHDAERYVMVTPSADRWQDIAAYFGSHVHGPAEKPVGGAS